MQISRANVTYQSPGALDEDLSCLTHLNSMGENYTLHGDLCDSCKTIPSLRELSNNYYTLHDTFQDFQLCHCPFCRWLYTYINSKPQFRNDFANAAKRNTAVELFGNLNFPRETESLQSLTLVSGSEDFMLYLLTRHGEFHAF